MVEAVPFIGNRESQRAPWSQHRGTLLQEADGVGDVLDVVG